MASTMFLLLAFVIWATIGVVAALVMGRRGHGLYTWVVLGFVFGPLVIPLARQSAKDEREADGQTVAQGETGDGPVDVLVGTDGSPQACAAVEAVVDLLAERIGRLTVVVVIDYDVALSELPAEEREDALGYLNVASEIVNEHLGWRPETLMLAGSPAPTLTRFASEHGCGLIAIGSRGRGASKLALGSVATRLARDAGGVPVLVANRAGHH